MTSRLKGLKKGELEERVDRARIRKIGDDSMRSYYHEIMGTEILPQYFSLKVGAYGYFSYYYSRSTRFFISNLGM